MLKLAPTFSKLMFSLWFSSLLLISQLSFAAENTVSTNQGTPIISGLEFEIASHTFKDKRRYSVSLPERYHANNRRYPVLYVIDGDFQFHHVSALATNLARMGKIPPMIVVGVATQGQNDYLYSTTWPLKRNDETKAPEYGGAVQMLEYLTHELLPRINKQYRTSAQNILAGYSMGGLFTFYSMLQQGPFQAHLAMSPSLWYDDYSAADKIKSFLALHKQPVKLFLSVANEEDMGVTEVVSVIEKNIESPAVKGANKSATKWDWQFKHYPDETHYSTAMPALYGAMEFLYPNYFSDLDVLLKIDTPEGVLAHFKAKQSLWGGFSFEWLQSYTLAKYFFITKQLDSVDDFLNKAHVAFPGSAIELNTQFAKAFIIKGQPEKALELLKKVNNEGEQSADWQQQVSLSYQALRQPKLAKRHHQQALTLAKKYQLASWEWWELNP
jgi:uncharacterized protein